MRDVTHVTYAQSFTFVYTVERTTAGNIKKTEFYTKKIIKKKSAEKLSRCVDMTGSLSKYIINLLQIGSDKLCDNESAERQFYFL